MAMIPPHYDSVKTTAVAIDRDKHSQHAVKWAIDHLLTNTQLIILVHVRSKSMVHPSNDPEVQQVFSPYRTYCARKSIQVREVVLDDADIPKAIIEYIGQNCISNLVVGASSRNALMKTFKKPDVSTSLTKGAPDFCSVYVLSKGKVVSVRSAQRPVANTAAPPKHATPHGLRPQLLSSDYPPLTADEDARAHGIGGGGGLVSVGSDRFLVDKGSDHIHNSVRGPGRRPYSSGARNSPTNLSIDNLETVGRAKSSNVRGSLPDDEGVDYDHLGFRSIDVTSQNLDFSVPSDQPTKGGSEQQKASSRDIEAEMKRLRQELKQTMDMYSTACKEAVSAKQKAKELNDWKSEEARKFQEARQAEEMALRVAEMEKVRCKAAIEAAQAAQKLAEMEAQKRRQAEMKAKKESDEKDRALTQLAQQDVRYRKYTIDEIEAATDKFSPSFKIGEGGYGPVYKGKLDHTPVAIKVLRPDAAQGRKQFHQEVEVLSSMRHPHMVLLLGACPEYGCLVYEFMNYGSLEDRLLRRGNTPSIPWRIRFKIAAEIGTALTFLHQAKPEPLVHRDLKPANILIDRNFMSKISDVGLSRLVPPSVANSVTQYHMTSAAGTFCYIDPEYQQTGMLTTKSDVYSLGIMLLQIITAKPPMGLSHHVQRAIDRGTFREMLDPTVPDWPIEEALRFATISLKCCELRKKDRPDLATVVLPELIQLRDFGMAEGGESSSISTNNHHSPHHSSTSSPGGAPHTTQQESARSNTSSKEASQSSDEGSGTSSAGPA